MSARLPVKGLVGVRTVYNLVGRPTDFVLLTTLLDQQPRTNSCLQVSFPEKNSCVRIQEKNRMDSSLFCVQFKNIL